MTKTVRSRWSGPCPAISPLRTGLMLLFDLLLAPPIPALAAPGDLDPSFDGDGKVLTDFRSFEFPGALVVQPDGKLVAAGDSFSFTNGNFETDFALARYNPDGSLDRSFGGDGRVRPNFGVQSGAAALVLQPDGKLVAAGAAAESFLITPDGVPASDVLLARFNPNGSLDASFGAGGVVRTDVGGGDSASALVLQPDGKLVTAGNRLSGTIVNAVSDLILARYHPDGSLDASFGAGGFIVESRGDGGSALVLQPDGKLVAADLGAFPTLRNADPAES